jgi:hypothetical protein
MAQAKRKPTPVAAETVPGSFIIDPAQVPERYALIVQGDCMAPLHRDGDVVTADKSATYARGDLVVIYIKPELVKPGRCNAMLKRLVSIPHWAATFPFSDHPESEIVAIASVETLNPPRRIHFRCSDILAMHRCTGAAPVGMPPASPLASRVHASDITRRSILTGAATVAAAATLAAPALAGHPDAEIFALADQIRAAAKRSAVALKPFTAAEEFMIAWKASNPRPAEPVVRDCVVDDHPDGGFRVLFAMGADQQAASREYSDAMAKWMIDLKEWSERASVARLECRLAELETAWNDSLSEIDELCNDVMAITAATVEGLKCKASLCEHNDEIAHSIVADLLELAGEVVS